MREGERSGEQKLRKRERDDERKRGINMEKVERESGTRTESE